jgi:hypothetical protein
MGLWQNCDVSGWQDSHVLTRVRKGTSKYLGHCLMFSLVYVCCILFPNEERSLLFIEKVMI